MFKGSTEGKLSCKPMKMKFRDKTNHRTGRKGDRIHTELSPPSPRVKLCPNCVFCLLSGVRGSAAPVSHSETPAGMWYARLTPTNP